MSTAAATKPEHLLTAEEFASLSDDRRTELVKGKVIDVPPPGFLHGVIQARIARLLGNFAGDQGHVLTESGTVIGRNPDTVRGPDVSFYSYERLPKGQVPAGYPAVMPEVIFEVLSPSQGLKMILPKVGEYLAAGTSAVCVVDPERSTVVVYNADDSISLLSVDDTLRLPAPLADWTPRISDFFPE